MVGFELSAAGSYSYSRQRGYWTEGSLWLLKQAIGQSGNKVADMVKTGDFIDAVEGSFTRLKEIRFTDLCFLKFNMDLEIKGSFNIKHEFREDKTSTVNCAELMYKISKQTNEMKDQVVLAICDTIDEFIKHCFPKESERSSPTRWLAITIKL